MIVLVCSKSRGRKGVTQVATSIGVSRSEILWLKKAAESGNDLLKHFGGGGTAAASQEYRYVSKVAKRDRNATPGQDSSRPHMQYWYSESAGITSLRLNNAGLYKQKPVKFIPLLARHQIDSVVIRSMFVAVSNSGPASCS